MKRVIPFIFIPFILTACNSNYVIEGSTTLSNLEGKTLFVKLLQQNEWVAVDSSEIIHGNFLLKGKVDSIVMTSLFIDDQNMMPVVLEKGKIKISLSYNDIAARGTNLNNVLYEFLDNKDELEKTLYDLDRQEARLVLDGRDIDEVRRELSIQADQIVSELDSMVKRVIVDNSENVLGPYVFMLLGNSLPYPLLTPQIEEILRDVSYTFKSNVWVKEFINKAKENMELIKEHQRMQN